MATPSSTPGDAPRQARARRRYDSPIRRQRTAETRDRIVSAGSELVHGFPSWDWRDLTFRAVAERAGVSERTVYRHFANEQELHRAVMRRLEEEAGITYEGLELEDLADLTARILESTLSFAVFPFVASPPFDEEDRRRHDALLTAVTELTGEWSITEREMAGGMLDVIWAIPSYERLLTSWKLEPADATRAVTWVIGLLLEAIREGRRPGSTETKGTAPARRRRRQGGSC